MYFAFFFIAAFEFETMLKCIKIRVLLVEGVFGKESSMNLRVCNVSGEGGRFQETSEASRRVCELSGGASVKV